MPTEWFPHERLAVGLAKMTSDVFSTTDLTSGLRHVVTAVADVVPGSPMVGAVVRAEDGLACAASSSVLGDLFDTALGRNTPTPCLDTMETGTPRHVRSFQDDDRWGRSAALAVEHGVASLYCHPLRTDDGLVGALGVYSRRPDAFDGQDREAVSLSAKHTGTLLGMLQRDHASSRLTEQLRQALDARSTVDQALGVIMAQRRCSREAAYGILRTASQNQGIPQAVLARQIVERVSSASFEPGPFSAPAARRNRPR